jgi:hypothetical protein
MKKQLLIAAGWSCVQSGGGAAQILLDKRIQLKYNVLQTTCKEV